MKSMKFVYHVNSGAPEVSAVPAALVNNEFTVRGSNSGTK